MNITMAIKVIHLSTFVSFTDSENYIFGKFDTFCRRLTRIADLVNTMESLSGLADVKIEGIDSLAIRFQGIVATHKKKSYDILDHRKGEVLVTISFYFLLNF